MTPDPIPLQTALGTMSVLGASWEALHRHQVQ